MNRSAFYCSTSGCKRQWRNVHARRCTGCGGENRPLKRVAPGTRLNYIADVPTHFNPAFGCEVRGRTHLRALQKQHGTVDYEPMNRDAPPAQFRRDMKRKRKGTSIR